VVTIENISEDEVHLLYRRSMDWDIEPTAFDEFVTMVPGDSSELVYTSDGGFDEDHVLDPPQMEIAEGAFVDSGPEDHGALFDFDFGALPAGESKSFTTFYGAAATEKAAATALVTVGAEAYTLGEANTADGPGRGKPNTFFFGFEGIGGSTVTMPPTATPTAAATATPHSCIPGLPTYDCGGQPGGGVSKQKTPTPDLSTATAVPSAAASATAAPSTPAALPTAAADGAGGVRSGISGPDTGSGGHGDDSGGNWLVLAIAMAVASSAMAGGAALARRRRS
jgi:hypothetical protein